MADQVTPLHIYDYQTQLEIKQKEIEKSFQIFCDKTKELYDQSQYQISWLQQEFDFKLPFELEPIIPSPVLEGYRNKCEFSAGLNLQGEKTFGFRLGAYREGIINTVLEADNSVHVNKVAKKIAQAFQGLYPEIFLWNIRPKNSARELKANNR
ncbi:MAG: hypothetical protein MRERC_9c067 [Mycoplasmataceae bacterium RC_NB112A]|nr:MAG: hypothetical protein MRERC_9c067 [Mycoplasmataceae bacterium RC_NB112A]